MSPALCPPRWQDQRDIKTDDNAMTTIWEIDFYSRPVLDDTQKKLWEVLICESPLDVKAPDTLFRYSQFFSNTEVNSVSLKTAVQAAIAAAPNPPDKVRFFRRQMNNMITKGCEEAGIPAYPSRRTLALNQWIEQRMQDYYPTLPNYQESNNPSVVLPTSPAQPLPDALIGEKWRFVTLAASDFAEMSEWEIGFSEAFPPQMFGASPHHANSRCDYLFLAGFAAGSLDVWARASHAQAPSPIRRSLY